MTAPTHIFDIATTLLDSVVAIYADASVPLPTRQCVVEGTPAWDCEMVVVYLRRTYPRYAELPLRCSGLRSAELHISIIRCASTPQDDGTPPTCATIESFSSLILTDAWLLPAGLSETSFNGGLGFPCDGIEIGDLIVNGPDGGFGGVDLTINYQLGDLTGS